MKIKITGVPNEYMREGGYFNPYPYAGSIPSNPFSIPNSQNYMDAEGINSTVKAVDKEDANVEAEKGEVLFKFDQGGLFDIRGKRHSEGGTPIIADDGDFIFSRDKSLAISEDEKDLFDFKQNGKWKEKENVPANVLKSEVNPKHYNQLLSILDNPKSDEIAKKTAQLMLEKYQRKIGQVAYLQESKKGFPQGLPEFSQGTAPVDAPEFAKVEEKEMMYAKKGGTNTFQPDQINSLRQRGAWDNDNYWNSIADGLREFGYTGDNNAKNVQNFVTQNYPQLVNYSFDNGYWPNTNKGVGLYGDVPPQSLNPDQQLNAFGDGLRGVRAPKLQKLSFTNENEYNDWTREHQNIPGTGFYDTRQGDLVNFTDPNLTNNSPLAQLPGVPAGLNIPKIEGNPMTRIPSQAGDVPKAGTAQGNNSGMSTQQPKQFTGMNIPWNTQEMLSTAAPFLSALAQPTYYDMLQQRDTPDIRLDRVNNDAEVSSIRQQSALAQREVYANMTGKNAGLATAGTRAQTLNQLSQSYGNVNNVNTQISNQEDMTNYAAANADRDFNLANIYKTNVNNTLSQQRRNEQLTNAFTDSLNKGLAIQSGLDALNQNLSAQVIPYVDQYGNSPINLDPRTRVAVSNPNWKGDPLNNPFIPGSTGRDKASGYERLLDEALQRGDTKMADTISRAILALSKQTRNQPSLLSRITQ